MIAKPPFTLPAKPVDLYEVRWWRADMYSDVPRVEESVATYYFNMPWKTLHPSDSRQGAAFVNEWRVVTPSSALGTRGGPWENLVRNYMWEYCFATQREAARGALERLATTRAVLERRLETMRAGSVKLARIAKIRSRKS